MTSDPKHLPPRDCLVLLLDPDSASKDPVWWHVLYDAEDGDYDEEGRVHGQPARWICAYDGEIAEPERVITWRELPEVE